MANEVRLQLFILAYNLGNFLRRLGLPKAVKDWSLRSLQVKLIKTAGGLVRRARRLVFLLAEVAMLRALLQGVLERIATLCLPHIRAATSSPPRQPTGPPPRDTASHELPYCLRCPN